jgi:hypothetical protein
MWILFFELPIYITILAILAIIGMIIAIECEKEGTATLIVAVGIGLLVWKYGYGMLDYLQSNIGEIILFVLGYLVVGIVWSFLKWSEKLKTVFRKFNQIRLKFIAKNGKIDDTNEKDFKSKLHNTFKDNSGYFASCHGSDSIESFIEKITPRAFENKSLIISWISYWPLSLIGTLLNNPFRRLFEWIYESTSGLYDKIANKYKNEAINDLK